MDILGNTLIICKKAYFPQCPTTHLIRRELDDGRFWQGRIWWNTTVWCMSMLTYKRDVVAYVCISDLIHERIRLVTRPHFPKVVGLQEIYAHRAHNDTSSTHTHTQLYYTYSSKYGLWTGTRKCMKEDLGWWITSPVHQWGYISFELDLWFLWLNYEFLCIACQPHSLSTADAHSSVVNLPLLLLVFASLSISPLSLFTQESVICGSADRVCNIPAELRRKGQTRERWWKTTPLPPSPLSPRSNGHQTLNLLLWPFTSMPSNFNAHIWYIRQGTWNRITEDHISTVASVFFHDEYAPPEAMLTSGDVFYCTHFIPKINLELRNYVFLIYN